MQERGQKAVEGDKLNFRKLTEIYEEQHVFDPQCPRRKSRRTAPGRVGKDVFESSRESFRQYADKRNHEIEYSKVQDEKPPSRDNTAIENMLTRARNC